jgi:hypothetical protein
VAGLDLRLQVDGADNLLHGLQRMMAASTRAQPMQRLVDRVRARLEKYPPPPPASTYVRTGDLGRGWSNGLVAADALGTNQYMDQVSIELHNPVEYAPYVQDEEHQAAVHRGRWTTAQQALKDETDSFLEDLSQSIEQAFGGRI